MSKGDKRRPRTDDISAEQYGKSHERIFSARAKDSNEPGSNKDA